MKLLITDSHVCPPNPVYCSRTIGSHACVQRVSTLKSSIAIYLNSMLILSQLPSSSEHSVRFLLHVYHSSHSARLGRLHDLSDASDLKRLTSYLSELLRVPRAEQYLCNLQNLSSFNLPSHMAFPSFTSIPNLSELIDTIIITDSLPVMLLARSMSQSCYLHVPSNVRCTGRNIFTR